MAGRIAKHIPPIEQVVGKDGAIMRELRKPQLMYVKHQNYGVRKLWKRLNLSKQVNTTRDIERIVNASSRNTCGYSTS